jgi:hypothetical protein
MRTRTTLVYLMVILSAGVASAQKDVDSKKLAAMQKYMEAMQKAGTPGPEHEKLRALTGAYDVSVKFWSDPAAPPEEVSGKSDMKMMFGDRYHVQEFTANMMGQPFNGWGMMGYDNAAKKWFSLWIDSTSTALYRGEGTVDKSGNVITFVTEATDPMTGKVKKGKDVMTLHPDGSMTSEMWGPPPGGGKPMKTMEIRYTKSSAPAPR